MNTYRKLFPLACFFAISYPVMAAPDKEVKHPGQLEEVVVTSRRREETLQDIPDAVTVLTSVTLEKARVDKFEKVAFMTPNMVFREGFNDGVNFTTMRGISTAQQGLPPVTYVIDGVQAASTDFINTSLFDLERVEVLRGPQGALYGAGAMAGAINVVTRQPSNDYEGRVKLGYAEGNDYQFQGVYSGPIIEDTLLFRVSAEYRNADGVVENNYGQEVDFDEHISLRAKLLWKLDNLDVDFRLGYVDSDSGAVRQDYFAVGLDGLPLIGLDKALNGNDPNISSDFVGYQEREYFDAVLKLDYEVNGITFTSITAYSEVDAKSVGDLDFVNYDGLGICGLVDPALNCTGTAQYIEDNVKSLSQEFRITSPSDQRFRWLAGAWYQKRDALLTQGGPAALNTDSIDPYIDIFGILVGGFPRADDKNDKLYAFFAQANYDISDDLELTLGLRHDKAEYDTTAYNCIQCTDSDLLILTTTPSGDPVSTVENDDSSLQPKVSLNYSFTDNFSAALTYAKGWRPGFFSTGNLAAAEDTENYELGFKSTWLDGAMRLNGAVFHIDYSDQQFSTFITTFPFRMVTNIPESSIDGVELELFARPGENLDIQMGLGWVEAEEDNGFTSPYVPEYTFNTSATYVFPVQLEGELSARLDYRLNGPMYMARENAFELDAIDYLDLRLNYERDNWRLSAFVDNLSDHRQPTEFVFFLTGFVKTWSLARQYGIEFSYDF